MGFESKTLLSFAKSAGQPKRERLMPTGTSHAVIATTLLRDGVACWGGGRSSSMVPLVRPSDCLLVHPLGARRVRLGDLVAVRRGGEIVVHRVVGCQTGGYWTKGDAMLYLDPFVPPREILGRAVILELPTGRRVSLDEFPWDVVQCGLGWLAWCAARLCPGMRPSWLRRLFCGILRLPFHVISALMRRGA